MGTATNVRALAAIISISSSFAIAPPADALVVVNNVGTEVGGAFGVSRNQYIGASFGTGSNNGGYNITEFVIYFGAADVNTDLSVSLYSGAIPTGAPLTLDLIIMPLNLISSYYSFDSSLIPNIASTILSPASSYTLALSTPSSNYSSWQFSRGTGGSSYTTSNGFSSSGLLLASFNQGGGWVSYSNQPDPVYRLSVNPVNGSPVTAPGPLPIFGVVTFMGYSCKLRKRIKNSKAPIGNRPLRATAPL
jgi:hypothetical protein